VSYACAFIIQYLPDHRSGHRLLAGGRIVAALFPPFDLLLDEFTFMCDQRICFLLLRLCFMQSVRCVIFCIPSRALIETRLNERDREGQGALRVALQSLWNDLVGGWRIISSDACFCMLSFSFPFL